jgi:hypothetical protein
MAVCDVVVQKTGRKIFMSNLNWQPGMTLQLVEKLVILQAFRFHQGDKSRTASAIGIPIESLEIKLNSYLNEEKEQERVNHEQRKQREEFQQRSRGIHAATPVPAGGTMLPSTDAGVSVEPAADAPQEQTVPVPERKEVQSMLHRTSSQGRARKARR